MLCSDVDTFALILGLAPISHLTRVSLDSYFTEIIVVSSASHSRQHRIRVPWRVPELGDVKALEATDSSWSRKSPVSLDSLQLAQYFSMVYLKMFEYEDLSKILSESISIMRQMMSPISADLRYYNRLSLVKLIHVARTNIMTDWRACMDLLVAKIESDKSLMIGSNSLQELYLHMHTFGLWESDMIALPSRDLYKAPLKIFMILSSDTGLLSQTDIPSYSVRSSRCSATKAPDLHRSKPRLR